MTNLLSYTFIIFVLSLLAVYYTLPARIKDYQWAVILTGNIVFYAFSGLPNFIFILTESLSSFIFALAIERLTVNQKKNRKLLPSDEYKKLKNLVRKKMRCLLALFLFINLGLLAYLKYFSPLFTSITKLLKLETPNLPHILLPLGISFYTFAAISYFMDVYNGRYSTERNFLKYLAFTSFFPSLISGPINHFDGTGRSILAPHAFSSDNIKRGILRFLFGGMKKYCIADFLYPHISALFDNEYRNLPGGLALAGILFYAVYQYADFSGGIDMVMGVSEMFGVKMEENFKRPYFSTSLADFWRRWHASLGLWMKNYLFYPFALSKTVQKLGKWCDVHIKKGVGRTVTAGLSNIVVFFFVGIWHGMALHFVVWGLYNGLVIAVSDGLSPLYSFLNQKLKINTKSRSHHIFAIIRTFIIVNIGWYFDRIESVKFAFLHLYQTFFQFGNPLTFLKKEYIKSVFASLRDAPSQIVLIAISLIIVFINSVREERGEDSYERIKGAYFPTRFLSYAVPLLLIILSLSFSPGNPVFMYAQY